MKIAPQIIWIRPLLPGGLEHLSIIPHPYKDYTRHATIMNAHGRILPALTPWMACHTLPCYLRGAPGVRLKRVFSGFARQRRQVTVAKVAKRLGSRRRRLRRGDSTRL